VPYLTLTTYRALSIVPSATIDRVEAREAGWIDLQLDHESTWIDAQLAKRYDAPFSEPYPKTIRLWLARIVDALVMDKGGHQPLDPQSARYYKAADDAKLEIAVAADAEKGHYELPLRADTAANGVTRGGPRSYTEASPYVGRDRQARIGMQEDRNRRGTSRG
jgi:hypothetical protein